MVKTESRTKHRTQPITLDRAIEVFARGFAFTRCFTHPYHAKRIGSMSMWSLRDVPRTRGNYRNEEWLVHGTAPEKVDRAVRARARGRFVVCAIRTMDEPAEPLRDGYKALGYRLHGTEPLMVHRLARIPRASAPVRIERVRTKDDADRLAKAAGARQVLPEHLTRDAPLRQYVARDGDELVGWVRSIVVGDATWCSNMYVEPAFRRRGIGRAMLCRVLRDDRTHGAMANVLTASHTGAKLYTTVGYQQIGTVMAFTPPRR